MNTYFYKYLFTVRVDDEFCVVLSAQRSSTDQSIVACYGIALDNFRWFGIVVGTIRWDAHTGGRRCSLTLYIHCADRNAATLHHHVLLFSGAHGLPCRLGITVICGSFTHLLCDERGSTKRSSLSLVAFLCLTIIPGCCPEPDVAAAAIKDWHMRHRAIV